MSQVIAPDSVAPDKPTQLSSRVFSFHLVTLPVLLAVTEFGGPLIQRWSNGGICNLVVNSVVC